MGSCSIQKVKKTLSYLLIVFLFVLNVSPFFELFNPTKVHADAQEYKMSGDLNIITDTKDKQLQIDLYLKNDLLGKDKNVSSATYELYRANGKTTDTLGDLTYDDNIYGFAGEQNVSSLEDGEYYVEAYVAINDQKIRQRAYFPIGENPSYEAQASNSWTKSASNPVLSTADINHARVIKSDSTYYAWMKNSSGNLSYYSTSNPVSWGTATACTESGAGNLANIHEPTIIKDGSTYRMWYESTTDTGKIKYRTSSDGIVWSAESSLTWSGGDHAWEDNGRYSPFVVKDGLTYKMWYQSFSNTSGETGDKRINYATSTDGVTFDNDGNLGQVSFSSSTNNNIVFSLGTSGQWDDNGIYSVSIAKHPETNYWEMWYAAESGDTVYKIGHATSADGVRWTRDANSPVLSPGASDQWDDAGIYFPTVLINDTGTAGNIYEMFYTGNDGANQKIGYATLASTDLTSIIEQQFVYDDASNTFQTVDIDTIGYTDNATGSVDQDLIKATEYAANAYTMDTTQEYKYWNTGTSAWVNTKNLDTYTIKRRTAKSTYNEATAIRKDNFTTTNDSGTDKVTSYQQEVDVTLSNSWQVKLTQNYDSLTSSVEIITPESHSAYLNGDPHLTQPSGTTQDLSSLGNYRFAMGDYFVLNAKSMKTNSGYSYLTDFSITGPNSYLLQVGRNGEVKVSGGTGGTGFTGYENLNYRIAPHNGATLTDNNITVEVEAGRALTSATLHWGTTDYAMSAVAGTNDRIWTVSITPTNDSYTFYVTDNESTSPQQTTSRTITVNVGQTAVATPVMNNYYSSSNWVAASSISGTATGSGLDEVQLKLQRLADSYYWNGSDWVSTDPGWLTATGTSTWTYSLALTKLTNASGYTVSARAHDGSGYGAVATDNFMYNNFNWQQYRVNPITWSNNSFYPTIVKDGSTYKGWYVAYSGGKYKLFYSTSTNGINWTEGNNGNPVFTGTAESWNANILEPWVIKDGSTYKMWYAAYNTDINTIKIGYATSSDGISWTNYGSSPVLDVGTSGSWDDKSLRRAVVVKDGSTYRMWYSGTRGSNTSYDLGYATSSDGISWTKSASNPVLTRGTQDTDWDYSNIWAISVAQRGGTYELYYTGNGASGQADNNHKIGYAYSTNGSSWAKYTNNPVMTHGASDTWNEAYVWSPTFLIDSLDGSTYYRMWYNGTNDAGTSKIGYATMDAPADTTDPVSSPDFDSDVDILAMTKIDDTYYAGPSYWDAWTLLGTNPLAGTASDDWGIEKVQLTFKGSDNNYWTGSAWSGSETWLNSSSSDGYMNWDYEFNSSNLTNGRTYTLTSKATDGSGSETGRVQSTPTSQAFVFDSQDPTAGITSLSQYYNSTSLPTGVTGTARDVISGVKKNDISVKRSTDNKYWNFTNDTWTSTQDWFQGTGTTSWSASLETALLNSMRAGSDGVTYTVYSRATDNVYNDASVNTSFIYDNTAPTSTVALTDSFYNSSTWTDTITGIATDAVSGVSSVNINIRRSSDNKYWNGEDWQTDISWLSVTGTTSWSYSFDNANMTTGVSYTVSARGTDNAGNVQSSYGTATFGYDDATPVAPTVYDGTTTGQETAEVESLTTLSANWSLSVTPYSGVSKYEYAIGTTAGGTDVASWTNNGTATSVTKSGLSLTMDQKYYVSVRITNGLNVVGTAGNSSGQTVVDHTAPVVSLTTTPSNPTSSKTPRIAGTSVDALSNINLVDYKIDDGSWVNFWSAAGTGEYAKSISFSFNTPTLSDGEHTVYVRSTDVKSNTSVNVSTAFAVDTEAPSAPVIDAPKSGEVVGTNKPLLDGSAEPNTTVHITLNSNTTHTYQVGVNGVGRWTYQVPDEIEEGAHTLTVKTEDKAGNTSANTSISFTVKTTTDVTTGTSSSSTSVASSTPVATTIANTTKTTEKQSPKISVSADNIQIVKDSTKQNQEVSTLPKTQLSLNIKPSLDKEVQSVTAMYEGSKIELKDKGEKNYSAQILSPDKKGTYLVKATVLYKDGTTEEINVSVLVDPYGYVYEKNGKGEQRLVDATITLYVKDTNGQWIVWDASKYSQKNPQTTLANGEYGFMVPAGTYYLTANKDGYTMYKSAEMVVSEGKPVSLNIQMQTVSNNWWIYGLVAILIIVGVGVYYSSRRKKEAKGMI